MEAVDRQQQQNRVIRDDDREIDRLSHGGVIILSALVALAPIAPLAIYVACTAVWLLLLPGCRRLADMHSGCRRLSDMPRSVTLRGIILTALALRLIASIHPPGWSGDVYRYLWDGIVTTSGIHPYRFAPIDPSLASLRLEWFDRINHPQIATIYPPYAQLLFALAGGSLIAWRAILIAFDLWTVSMLAKRNTSLAFAYATSPLILFEGFWNAHVDVVAAAFLLASLTTRLGMTGLAIAAGIKLTPIAALPAILRDAPRRSRSSAIFLLVFALPILLMGVMPGFRDYATRWSFNSPAFLIAKSVAESIPAKEIWTAIKDPLHLEALSAAVYRQLHPDFMARAILAIVLIVTFIVLFKRVRDTTTAVADSLGALLLLTPTIHPWYWMVVFPVALIAKRHLWLWLAVASPFSYLLYQSSENQTIVLFLCYALPIGGWLLTEKGEAQ